MTPKIRYLIPIAIGLLGSALLTGLYFGIVSWAESPEHAIDLFWEERALVIPILLGFGVQAGLYSARRMRLHVPSMNSTRASSSVPASGLSMGAGGTTSTLAMAACCAHHVTDVLPVLGLTAAATFLAKYQTAFMAVGLVTNITGIGVITAVMIRERKAVILHFNNCAMDLEEI